jgi:tRNA pseudouridine55 synthase
MIVEKSKEVRSWSKSELHGLLPVNKEVGPTSHDTVNRLRNILGYRKIGHTGTLDPAASGLLLTCLGRGCKIVQFLHQWDKEYVAEIKLGEETDTYDAQGKVVKVQNYLDVNEDEIRKIILSFKGEDWQLPPSYSALKFKGKKLYQYAREGKSVPRRLKKIKIINIEIKDISLPLVRVKVACTSGTYIRTLAYDIGKKLGCGAHLSSLCRTRVGHLELEHALTFQELERGAGEIFKFLISIEDVFDYLPSLIVKNHFKDRIKNGMELKSYYLDSVGKEFAEGERLTLKDEAGNILAIGNSLVSSGQIFGMENENKIFEYKRVLV